MTHTNRSGPLEAVDLEFLGYHDVTIDEIPKLRKVANKCRVFKAKTTTAVTEHIE